MDTAIIALLFAAVLVGIIIITAPPGTDAEFRSWLFRFRVRKGHKPPRKGLPGKKKAPSAGA